MGFGMLGRLAGNYNNANDAVTGHTSVVGGQDQAESFLGNWMGTKLPELITGLAVRVVDDGSGTAAKEIIDAGKGEGFFGGIFRGN
jgi:hypothetical protein